jgi:hypothetical protein
MIYVSGKLQLNIVSGASGLALWRLGNTHYHFVMAWSAPRNFYAHSNTIMFGLTSGRPIQIEDGGYGTLFNHMYNGTGYNIIDGISTFFTKVVCVFGEQSREGSFSNNRFQIGGRLGQEHKHWSTFCLRDAGPAMYSTLESSEQQSDAASFHSASVKLLTHSYQSNWRKMKYGNSKASAIAVEKSHVVLLIETKKKSAYGGSINSVWICELTGHDAGKRDVSLTETASVRCEEIGSTTSGIVAERKKLGLRSYNMGIVQMNVDDLLFASRTIGVDFKNVTNFSDRNLKWIRCLAAKLNVKDQDVISLARDNVERVRKGADMHHHMDSFVLAGGEFGMTGMATHGISWPSTIVSNEKLVSMECDV